METDICPAKHLGMNQPTRGMRLSARRLLPSRQGLHASVLRWQQGHHAGDCPRLAEEEQARQDAQLGDTTRRIIHAPVVLTMPPEVADASESRRSPKIRHFAFKCFTTGEIFTVARLNRLGTCWNSLTTKSTFKFGGAQCPESYIC